MGVPLLALAVCCGCVKYQAHPLQPEQIEREFRSRTLRQPAGTSLDLPALAAVAAANSPDLAVARARLRAAEAAVLTAAAKPNPSISVGAGYTDSPESPVVAHFEPVFTIETAGKRAWRTLAAQKQAEAARLEVAETAWRVRSRVRAAWLDHLLARRSLVLLRDEAARRRESVELLEARLRVGEIARPEVDRERAGLLSVEVAARAAETQAAESLAALAAALGLPAAALAQASFASLPPPPAEASLPLPRVLRAGLLNRLDIRRSLAEYAAAEAALQLEVARQYPDIQLTPGYSFDEGHHKIAFGPSFPVPVFNRNRGPIAEAEAHRAEAQARCEALEARAIGEMEQAVAAYRGALAELAEAAGRLRELQQVREGAVLRAVRAGEEDRLALAGVRLERLAGARAELDALRRAETALGALENAVGQPLEGGAGQ
ncbi:MAG TPA: TolC family protein [Bryobacteraceae bacterium]|nr:TolC family protein [Bryobacteraceae bacterium]